MNSLAEVRSYAEATDWTPSGGPRPPAVQATAAMAVATSRRKRAFDIILSGAALLFFLPLLMTVALLIRLESQGPALFRQRRTGLNGTIFTVFKFRTMRVEEDGAVVRQATQNDSRITPLGAILRKYSIDELPQLLNVLRGEMSLIGPRPHAVAHDVLWTEQVPGYARRFRTRPGLTGYAAVCGFRGEVRELQAIMDRVQSDNEYIDTWSFGLDLKIVWRTIPLVFSDTNAY
ncbi:MAG: sugar transferase [Phenylobacterium sp.]|nr:sugar transferase [Phenylobacterium sp.]